MFNQGIFIVFQELYDRCDKLRRTAFKLATETEDNDASLGECQRSFSTFSPPKPPKSSIHHFLRASFQPFSSWGLALSSTGDILQASDELSRVINQYKRLVEGQTDNGDSDEPRPADPESEDCFLQPHWAKV